MTSNSEETESDEFINQSDPLDTSSFEDGVHINELLSPEQLL
jgi:hypothetical protein